MIRGDMKWNFFGAVSVGSRLRQTLSVICLRKTMGRGSQIFWFLSEEKMPTDQEQRHFYTHLAITDDLKKLRKEYRHTLRNSEGGKKQLDLFREL